MQGVEMEKLLDYDNKQRPCLALLSRRTCNNVYRISLTSTRWKHVRSNVVEGDEVKPLKRKWNPKSEPCLPVQADHEQVSASAVPSSLSNLKLNQLQDLARTLGISQTAPKQALTSRLLDTLTHTNPLPPASRILSIDLGIRNLAYALLTPPLSLGSNPTVHAWNRVDLRTLSSGDHEGKYKDFTPPHLSTLALELVSKHLLPLQPSHVLIEKQRFRSGGGSAVLEWTVRVNSLESMLYAIFATLKRLGGFDGVVIPIDPRYVGPFLLGDEGEGVEKVENAGLKVLKKGSKENKRLKIDLVGGWMRDGKGVEFEGEGEVMRRAFLRRWLPRERKKKKMGKGDKDGERVGEVEEEEMIPKLDDVADCLLQGVAWLRWEENKRRLKEELGGQL
ncbi:mitochondrial resolvase Ydc2 [Coniochaeta sp. 2T2.1]|nr:mitochondrial resolvase Ydc2 [Coniochaeta sp. 2T2.1]